MTFTAEQQALIDSIQDCPWCPGTKPGFDTGLEGMRDDPYRYARLVCGKCGAFRKLLVHDTESQTARTTSYATGRPFDRELALVVLPRLVQAWNRP